MLVECEHCEATVDAEILEGYEHHGPPEDGPPSRFNFGRCPRCSAPFLIGQTDWGRGFEDAWRMFPADRVLSYSIPEPIRDAYSEALKCHRVKAHAAAAIMCRKTVEGLCVAHGITSPNLATSLKMLRDQGIIESRLFEWADALRLSGNEAAHGVALAVPAEDAKDILEFTNALLEYVFTFRDRFAAFQERRKRRQTAT